MTSMPGHARRSIPLARPDIGARELELVTQVLQSDVLALGPSRTVRGGIAALAGRRYGIACTSGTAGLHMAFAPSASARATRSSRRRSASWPRRTASSTSGRSRASSTSRRTRSGSTRASSKRASTPRTEAILPVHVFGRPCRIEAIDGDRRGARGWAVIEDACEALGSSVGGRPLGQLRRRRRLRLLPEQADHDRRGRHGRDRRPDPRRHDAEPPQPGPRRGRDVAAHVRLGYNYRLDELSAALGVAQLERLDELRARAGAGRRRVRARPSAAATGSRCPRAGAGEIGRLVRLRRPARPEIDRDRSWADSPRGVPTRPYFAPLHLQPFYREPSVTGRRFPGHRARRRLDARVPVLVPPCGRRRPICHGRAPRGGRC